MSALFFGGAVKFNKISRMNATCHRRRRREVESRRESFPFFLLLLRVLTHEEKILLDMLPSTHSPLVLYMNRKRKWLWGIGQHWIGDDADKLLLAGRLPSQHFTFTRPANYLFFSRRIWGSPFKFTIEDGVVSEEKELLSKIGHQHDGVRAGEKKSIQYVSS